MILSQNKIPQLLPTRKIHFLGIGGSGMAPLAEVAFLNNYEVTGSDISYSDTVQYLINLGIPISIGNSSENLIGKEDLTVIYSSAIKDNNLELREAKLRNLPLMHRSDLLNFFISQKSKSITVAGTHGKSTSTSMISYLLYQLGQNPLAVVGAKLTDFDTLALNGNTDYAVAEADESDGTLLKYHPHTGVLTSVDFDHMDYYKDHDHILKTYEKYLSNIDPKGCAILNYDDPYCYDLFHSVKIKKVSYGFNVNAHVQAFNYICKNSESYFSVKIDQVDYKAKTKLIGKHNCENALASYACGISFGFSTKDCLEALESFSGVKRRLECVYKSKGITIYDDYAHNPTKIKSVLNAVRNSSPESFLIVIFQPHRHTRIKTLYNNFVGSFLDANAVFVLPTYSSGEQEDNPIPSEGIALDIAKTSHVPSLFVENFEKAKEKIAEIVKKDSIIITLGAGDVWLLAQILKERFS